MMTIDATGLLPHLQLSGILLAVIAIVNLFVPSRLHWREEMAALSLVNRQIFQVHTIFIVVIVTLCAALLLLAPDALLEPTRASRALLVGLTLFWGLRMLMQWFYYSPAIWRGNRFNTAMHWLFSVVWTYIAGTFAAALMHHLAAGG